MAAGERAARGSDPRGHADSVDQRDRDHATEPGGLREYLRKDIDGVDAAIHAKYAELPSDPRIDPQDRVKLPGRRDGLLAEPAAISLAVDDVDPQRPGAPEQLKTILLERLRPLERRVTGWGRDAGIGGRRNRPRSELEQGGSSSAHPR
ncbi:hypothetical protein ABZ412_34560 [Nocardia sp. NPDC005746]|uniref:hypothetical protein n=1 Tax=Nocardia sp. NPDC005746 TaxID=3157062 RepID=UPI0033C2A7F8